RQTSAATLKALQAGCHPKEVIAALAEGLLAHYAAKPLIDPYDVYQYLMDYWAETMQDDCYLIAADGWKAETTRIIEKDKKGKEKDKGSLLAEDNATGICRPPDKSLALSGASIRRPAGWRLNERQI